MGEPEDATLKRKTESFLQEFFATGESLVRDLIEENERLRVAAGQGRELPNPEFTEEDEEVLRKLVNRLEALERECGEIRQVAGLVQQESGGYRERLEALEREHYHLAAMYVAGSQFQSAATLEEVLRTVTEILLNFVGIGAFTIYGHDETKNALFPLAREGGDPEAMEELGLDAPGVAEVSGLGRAWHPRAPRGSTDGVLMHLPLVAGSRLTGMVRCESFLPQKSELVDADCGLLELLSDRAGIGIETAWLRAHADPVPMQRAAVEALVNS